MPRTKTSPALIAFIVLMMIPVIYTIFSVGVSIAYLSLPILAFGALGWFSWRIWGRVMWRANRINHLRERRLLDEASRR